VFYFASILEYSLKLCALELLYIHIYMNIVTAEINAFKMNEYETYS